MSRAERQHVAPEELVARPAGTPMPLPARLHLERCAPCRERLEEAEEVLRDARVDQFPAPGDELRTSALALLDRRPRLPAAVPPTLLGRRLPVPAAAGGVRGDDSARRRVYRFDRAEVALGMTRGQRGRRVTGQVVPLGGAPVPLVAWAEAGGREICESPVSRHGVFVLDALPDTPIDVLLDDGEARLRLVVEPEEQP